MIVLSQYYDVFMYSKFYLFIVYYYYHYYYYYTTIILCNTIPVSPLHLLLLLRPSASMAGVFLALRAVPIVELFLLPVRNGGTQFRLCFTKGTWGQGCHYFDGEKVRVPPFGTGTSEKSPTIGTTLHSLLAFFFVRSIFCRVLLFRLVANTATTYTSQEYYTTTDDTTTHRALLCFFSSL